MIFRSGIQHRRLWVSVWVLLVLTVIAGSMMPSYDLPDMQTNMDKVLHFFGYLVLAGFAASVFKGRFLLLVTLALAALGGLIEIAQGTLTTTRSADMKDFYVDLAGVLVGFALAYTPLANLLGWFERLVFGASNDQVG